MALNMLVVTLFRHEEKIFAEVVVARFPSSPIFQLAPANQQSLGADVHSRFEGCEFWLPHWIVFKMDSIICFGVWQISGLDVTLTFLAYWLQNLCRVLLPFTEGSYGLH